MTSILVEDTAATLQLLGCLQNIKGEDVIYIPPDVIEDLIVKFPMNGLQVGFMFALINFTSCLLFWFEVDREYYSTSCFLFWFEVDQEYYSTSCLLF